MSIEFTQEEIEISNRLSNKTQEGIKSFREFLVNKSQGQLDKILYIAFYGSHTPQLIDPTIIRMILQRGGNANLLVKQNLNYKQVRASLLMLGCLKSSLQNIRQLLKYKVNIYYKDQQQKNCLFYAIENRLDSNKILNCLFEIDQSLINSTMKNNKTLLIYAVERRNKNVLINLIHRKINIDAVLHDTKESALHLAAKISNNQKDSKQITEILLQMGANKQLLTIKNKTAEQLCNNDLKKIFAKYSYNNSKKQYLQKNKMQGARKLNYDKQKLNKVQQQFRQMQSAFQKEKDNWEEERRKLQTALRQTKLNQSKLATKVNSLQSRIQNHFLPQQQFIPSQSVSQYITQQIKYFQSNILKQNNQKQYIFQKLINNIKKILYQTFELKVKVYGSYATKLCLPLSDIDIVVQPQNNKYNNNLLSLIQIGLKKKLDYIIQTKLIDKAAIPVLKATCDQTYYYKKIDITLADPKHNGSSCVQIIRQYMRIFWQLKPLTLVLKNFIYSNNLSDTYQGGLSSYGLILMIVGYLQFRQYTSQSLGTMLLQILYFYGISFDYILKYIQVQKPIYDKQKDNYYLSRRNIYGSLPYNTIDNRVKLFIVDPINQKNNVGRSTYNISKIKVVHYYQVAFAVGYSNLHIKYSCLREECKLRNLVQNQEQKKPCCFLQRMFGCATGNIYFYPSQ